MEQARWPRMLGGDNFIGLPNLMKPASAGPIMGITHLLPKCALLAAEDRDPQLAHEQFKASQRSLEHDTRIPEKPLSEDMNVERTAKMYGTIVDKSDDDEVGTEPRGNYQRISECRDLRPQQFYTTLQCTADKAPQLDGRPNGVQAGQTSNAGSIAILRRSSELHRPNLCQPGTNQQCGSVCILH
jgi:hypothetical protein